MHWNLIFMRQQAELCKGDLVQVDLLGHQAIWDKDAFPLMREKKKLSCVSTGKLPPS